MGNSNGYDQINLNIDENKCIAADSVVFESIGSTQYLALDEITWSKDMIPSSITSITSTNNNLCPNYETSITLSTQDLVIGDGANLIWNTKSNGTGLNLGFDSTLTIIPTISSTYFARLKGYCNTIESSIDIIVNDSINTTVVYSESNLTLTAPEDFNTTIEWYECNGVPTNTTGSVFSPETVGSYYATISKGGCIDTSNCTTVDKITNLQLPNELNFISPNPVNSTLNINIDQLNNNDIVTIYNNTGTQILKNTVREIGNRINVNELKSGLYIIQIDNGVSQIKTRFIRE